MHTHTSNSFSHSSCWYSSARLAKKKKKRFPFSFQMVKISSKVVKLGGRGGGSVVSWAHNKLWKHLAFPSQSIRVGLNRGPGRYMAAVFTHIWFSKWIFLCLHYWSESQYNECLPWRWHRGGLILPHFPKWAHFKRLHILPARLADCVCRFLSVCDCFAHCSDTPSCRW